MLAIRSTFFSADSNIQSVRWMHFLKNPIEYDMIEEVAKKPNHLANSK